MLALSYGRYAKKLSVAITELDLQTINLSKAGRTDFTAEKVIKTVSACRVPTLNLGRVTINNGELKPKPVSLPAPLIRVIRQSC